jgi:hypothetical protein
MAAKSYPFCLVRAKSNRCCAQRLRRQRIYQSIRSERELSTDGYETNRRFEEERYAGKEEF